MIQGVGGAVTGRELPLRWRLPNTTAFFVGRDAECARLADTLQRSPLAVVWGLGGLGKTSLVLRTLHERFPDQVDRVLFVSLREHDDSPQAAVEVVRALCAAEGIRTIDWSALLSDESALIETAIDLAEHGPYWIVIDDLHHADRPSTEALLRAVNRYARQSRWVITSRVDWRLPELEAQRVALGVLPDGALAELAHQLDAELPPTAIQALVRRASGSPWRMRVALGSTGDDDLTGHADGTFADLGPDALDVMRALVPVEAPLPRSVLAQALPTTPREVWVALERRGIIENRAGGWRLHDMVRALLRANADPARADALADRVADALAASGEPSGWIEALRLAFRRGDPERARALLEAHGRRLLAAGYAPDLWRLLEPVIDRAMASWRLQCGAELGTPEVLAMLREPTDPTPEESTAWGQALFAMGRMQEAAQVVRGAIQATRASGRATAAAIDAELLFLHAQTLASLSDQKEMLVMMQVIASGQPEVRSAVMVAKLYALMGVFEPALSAVARVMPRVADLPPETRLLVYLDILVVHLSAGRMTDADEVLRRIDTECGEVSLVLYTARYLQVLRASVSTHLGRCTESSSILHQLLPFTGRSAVQRPIVQSLILWVRLAQGDLSGLTQELDQVIRDFTKGGNEYFTQWGHALKSLDDRQRAIAKLPQRDDGPALTGAGGNLVRIYRLIHRARHGQSPDDSDHQFLQRLHPEGYLWSVGRLIPAIEALRRGDSDTAIRECTVAAQTLTRLGNHLYANEVRELLADALLLAGRRDDLQRVADELTNAGAKFPSARFQTAAEFASMSADPRGPVPELLERLALKDDSNPVVTRRARALLGATPALDEIDKLVVGELQRRSEIRTITKLASTDPTTDWQPGWGLDATRKVVWLPDGQLVELEDHPIRWACLEAIAQNGGSATREELIPAIWPGETYDPTVHNNRLNPAIRKLRVSIEADPSKPKRLVTTADGYGFGDDEPLRYVRTSPAPP